MEVLAKGNSLKEFNQLAKSMIEAGQLKESNLPNWDAVATIATMSREEADILWEGKGVRFRDLPKELKVLEGKSLKLRGTGPVIRIAIAEAARTETYTFQGKDYVVTEGDRMIRAFS